MFDKTLRSSQSPAPSQQAYLTETELAMRLNLSVKWLQKMRLVGGGIPYAKFGSAVRYPIDAIEDFERKALRGSTSEVGAS